MQLKLPHEIKSEETKRKILTATKDMLAQYDFKYLTVRNICDEAGVAYGSFYHHFGNKENVIYQFICDLFLDAWKENSLPSWIPEKDYIKTSLWYFMVYGAFCETLGKDLLKYLYTSCKQEMFAEMYRKEIQPRIVQAEEMGYLDDCRFQDAKEPPVALLCKDLEIICKGVLLWWSNDPEPEKEPLYETVEHLCFNMLYAYSADSYEDAGFPRELPSEMKEFPGSIHIDNIFTQKNK